MFRATIDAIKPVEMHASVSEHVDAGTWEAFGNSASRAKNMLVDALEKRRRGAIETLKIAETRLKKAEALKLPDANT